MNIKELLVTRQFMACTMALFLFQRSKNKQFVLPLGLEFDFSLPENQKIKVSKKASRLIKNSLGIHYYSSEPIIDKPTIPLIHFKKCCQCANHYNLDELTEVISEKMAEHFGGETDLDNSAVVYLIHKIMRTQTPAKTREILTSISYTFLYLLAHKKQIPNLPYGVSIKLNNHRNGFTIQINQNKKA